MQTPGITPPADERPPVDPLAVREFNRIVLPLNYADQLPMFRKALRDVPVEDGDLYGRVQRTLPPPW